ncbi:MAG TPA: response regulator [Candidatus Moranbacteria bacterium]|nr:response regulator [Candidatus Moranbacteria bacterium]
MDEEKKLTILLAEDDESLREIYNHKLISEGFDMILATNGEEAVEQVKKNNELIDLILMDVIMPKMDGFDALKKIKGKYKKIPVIVLTSLGDPEDRSSAMDLGADRFFVKSERTPSDLAREVKELLAETRINA